MTSLKKGVIIFLIAAACLGGLAAVWSLRLSLIEVAHADLKARGYGRIEIFGMRIPCSGLFDIGVAAVIRKTWEGEPAAGRLCRPLDWSSEWTWHPNGE